MIEFGSVGLVMLTVTDQFLNMHFVAPIIYNAILESKCIDLQHL